MLRQAQVVDDTISVPVVTMRDISTDALPNPPDDTPEEAFDDVLEIR